MSDTAILVESLAKRFGDVVALDGIDFQVPAGSVFGLLGPNGAGKTTAIRILTTILRPDGGRAEVLGLDVVRQAEEVRYRIGLAGQYAAIDPNLTGRENLRLTGRLAQLPTADARTRADELLERFQLTDAGDRPARTYSGGMRRRLDVAAALVQRPPVVFLDEPTAGLDLQSRNALWEMIRELVAEGSVCGLLGPNGAGKTTAVRILTTLLRPDGGRAWVAGFDVVG
ncbi:MAG TPA: ATP-binding cassette domain-containing protein, partial [Actinomycetes bacterium]